MLSVCILIGMAIVLIGFLIYGWKKRIFIENYEIYWIASGVAIFLVAFHVFERVRYQNFVILVVNDVILFAAFVVAGIIGYCQSKQK